MKYEFMEDIFLRTPAFSYAAYDPARLPEVLGIKAFQDAIFLASTTFYHLLEAKYFDYSRLNDKEKHTALKYYNRMSFRPVPYGSFASFTNLKWNATGETQLQPESKNILHLLPDMAFLQATDPAPSSLLALNPLLYQVGGQYRYIRSLPGANGRYEFMVSGIDAEPFYEGLFRYFGGKKKSIAALIAYTCNATGCDVEEARGHLDFLTEEQVLLTAAQLSPINPAPSGQLSPWPDKLKKAHGSLAALGVKVSPSFAGQPFYAALERPLAEGGPGQRTRAALEKAIALLQRLASPQVPAELAAFISAFRDRFGQQEAPLLLALDPDTGISYGGLTGSEAGEEGPLYGLPFPSAAEETATMPWTATHRMLFRLWQQDVVRHKYAPVEITDADLSNHPTENSKAVPPATSVVFRETEEHILLEQAGGANGVSMIGRFSAFSKDCHAMCRRVSLAEGRANPGVVFADISQLSAPHTDNINRRKPIYPYEIPLNCVSSLALSRQLPPSGLYLSLKGNELVLYSKKLGKRILPRLATAYNYRNTQLGIFRLLCDMQYQGLSAGFSFSLENFFPGLPFYPRVFTGEVILSLAKWHFNSKDLEPLVATGTTEALLALRAFRKQYGLPQRVSMGHTDQQLVFDLAQPAEAQFFLNCLKGQKTAAIQEYLLPARTTKCGHTAYVGQAVAFLSHAEAAYRPVSRYPVQKGTIRDFPPGSEWLYLKLYCTPGSASRLLTDAVAPALAVCQTDLARWHFVRFNDSAYHIRLRVKMKSGSPLRFIEILQHAIAQAGLHSLVQEFRADTYRRELERYHPALIDRAEDVFHASSNEALCMIAAGETGSPAMSLNAFSGVLQMISAFLLTTNEALAFCESQSERFLKEFRADKPLRLALDHRFREMRGILTALARSDGAERTPEREALIAATIAIRDAASLLSSPAEEELLASLVHMHLNRIFPEEQRKQELLVYYCLAKHLRSLNKRKTGLQA